ncbi:MAG: FtsX-like permease family protein [Gemmatimonadaceae bacterium]|nr:FtsX-like permease family protein [Gemmatimonadaceae bacterium]
MLILLLALALQGTDRAVQPQSVHRGIAIDERLAADAKLRVGAMAVLTGEPNASSGDTVRIAAIVRRRADPSEIARSEYRVRLHLDQLQSLLGYGDRVDRFAVATRSDSATTLALKAINASAFGFRAHRSSDIAVETSETFRVVSRFHDAIGVITIVASAVFLLCVLLLKVDERRRDIAALRLAGISRRTIMSAVVLEAALVAVLGSVVGVALGWLTAAGVNSYYQGVYRTPLKFALVTPNIVLLAVSLSLVLGIGAGALAALRLVRTPPLDLLGR